jgi:hypothetical protein
VNWLNRLIVFSLTALILSLNIGVDVFRVHCDMRGKTYVSLLTAYDPCVEEQQDDTHKSCCAAASHCSIEDEEEKNSCCGEEQITITYEPDFFHKIESKIFADAWDYPLVSNFSFSRKTALAETATLPQFPLPPPKSGREILSLHAVLRI